MIDHLMNFATEVDAQADPIVGKYWTPESDDGSGAWRGDVCLPGVSVYTLNPDFSRTPFPGWFVVIALPALDPNLQAEPGCVLIADRDKAAAGDPAFLLYTQPGLTPEALDAARIEPVFAGSRYPFGNVP